MSREELPTKPRDNGVEQEGERDIELSRRIDSEFDRYREMREAQRKQSGIRRRSSIHHRFN